MCKYSHLDIGGSQKLFRRWLVAPTGKVNVSGRQTKILQFVGTELIFSCYSFGWIDVDFNVNIDRRRLLFLLNLNATWIIFRVTGWIYREVIGVNVKILLLSVIWSWNTKKNLISVMLRIWKFVSISDAMVVDNSNSAVMQFWIYF